VLCRKRPSLPSAAWQRSRPRSATRPGSHPG
jgi:hypothetical protein